MINVTARAKTRDGIISVYSLSREMVNMLSGVVKSEIVPKDLSNDNTSLDKLITKTDLPSEIRDDRYSGEDKRNVG